MRVSLNRIGLLRDTHNRHYRRRYVLCSVCGDIMPVVYLVEKNDGERIYVCTGCYYRNKHRFKLAFEADGFEITTDDT